MILWLVVDIYKNCVFTVIHFLFIFFKVLANDTDGLQDIAHVFIYLLREDQRVRFVLRQQPPQIRDRLDMFREYNNILRIFHLNKKFEEITCNL